MQQISIGKQLSYALTRAAGIKKLTFWYEWSIFDEKPRSALDQILSRLFWPLLGLYFWILIYLTWITKSNGHWPESHFLTSISDVAENFKKNGGEYLLGEQVTFIDILMLAHFQCMFSGSNGLGALSKEVIPLIDQHPSMWQWLKNMHQHPSFIDYPYMYTQCDATFMATVMQRTGGIQKG